MRSSEKRIDRGVLDYMIDMVPRTKYPTAPECIRIRHDIPENQSNQDSVLKVSAFDPVDTAITRWFKAFQGMSRDVVLSGVPWPDWYRCYDLMVSYDSSIRLAAGRVPSNLSTVGSTDRPPRKPPDTKLN